jgi:hypothetical protein
MPDEAAGVATGREGYVLLVHGTFAYQERDEGKGWFQRRNEACLKLARRLGARYRVNPKVVPRKGGGHEEVPEPVFCWSGRNSERARRLAAEALLGRLGWFEARGLPYHVVAHSHGGSVLWEALQLAVARRPPAGPTPPGGRPPGPPLAHLESWTTVGTPFLHFVPSLSWLRGLVLLGVTLAVLARQASWLGDTWRAVGQGLGLGPFGAFCGLTLAYAAWAVVPALILLAAFRVFKVARTQASPTAFPDARTIEFFRLIQAFATMLVAGLALGLPWLLWPALRRAAPAAWRVAWERPELVLPVLYGFAAAGLVAGGVATLVLFGLRARECRRRARLARDAWGLFHGRHHLLSCVAADEAINGLRQCQNGIAGPLLPRLPAPGASEYGVAGRTRTPEALAGEARPNLKLLGRLASLPVRQAYDWVLRPLYNHVFAELVDEFVLARFTAQAHGADVPGLRLGFVSATAIPLRGDCPEGFRHSGFLRDPYLRHFTVAQFSSPAMQAQVRERFAGPSPGECADLMARTGPCASKLLEGLRTRLGVPSEAAVSFMRFLAEALKGAGDWADLLIHTSYFKHDGVRERIAHAIDPAVPLPGPRPRLPARAAAADPDFRWPPTGFAWWAARAAVRGLLVAAPALALAALGWLVLYPESREAQLRWASAPATGLATLIHDAEQPGMRRLVCMQMERVVPSGVRWYAAVRALGLDPDGAIDRTADALAGRGAYLATVRPAVTVVSNTLDVATAARPASSADVTKVLDRVARALAAVEAKAGGTGPPDLGQSGAEASTELVAALDELVAALDELVAACGSYRQLDSRTLQRVLDRAGGVAAIATQPRIEIYHLVRIVGRLLALDRSLQEQGGPADADRVMAALEPLVRSLPSKADAPARTVIDLAVLVAKANRWPESREPRALRLLALARRLAEERLPLYQRVEARALIAGGYARLGRFRDARVLSEGAGLECRLGVALQSLANEYERRAGGERARLLDHLSRGWEVFDEPAPAGGGGVAGTPSIASPARSDTT